MAGGGLGRAEGGRPCRGRVRGRRDRPRPGSRRAGGSGCPPLPLQRPLPPPPPPQSQARPPRTCAKRHRRVPGRGTDPGGGTGTRLPPPSVAGGRGGGQGGEGRGKGRGGSRAGPGPGEEGPGARATRAPPRTPPGCAQAGAPGRESLTPGQPTPQLAPGFQPHLPRHPSPPPPAPLLPGVTDPQMCQAPHGRAPAPRARLGDLRQLTGLRGRRGAITPTVSRFPAPRVPHSPVHDSLPHPLLHPGRDPFLRPRKRKLRVGGEGKVGVGKSAGKERGGRQKFLSV